MATLEDTVREACDAGQIPGIVLTAVDVTGAFRYAKAFGPATPNSPMTLDSTFIMASCTKLMTSIAAMQCVERGLVILDEDVSKHLPELKDLPILTGFNDEKNEPEYQKSSKFITLRHLLTHTSGLGYDGMSPLYAKWRAHRGQAPGTSGEILMRISLPLLFEPGSSWSYGVGTDWTGLLVGRLNNCSLEEFMEKNIWTPLGIKNMTFHQELKPEVKKNLVKLTQRKGIINPIMNMPSHTSEPVEWTDELIYDDPTPDEFGGSGVIGNPGEYMKVLLSLASSDDKLLKTSSIDEMFRPQLSDEPEKAYQAFCSMPVFEDAFSFVKMGTKLNYGLGGFLICEDVPTGRKSGTMSWSGVPNLCWTIDRQAGLCCMYASNLVPYGDFKSGEVQRLFEKEMYERAARAKSGKL